MLSINIALGFKPAGYDGEWQRIAAGAGAAGRGASGGVMGAGFAGGN